MCELSQPSSFQSHQQVQSLQTPLCQWPIIQLCQFYYQFTYCQLYICWSLLQDMQAVQTQSSDGVMSEQENSETRIWSKLDKIWDEYYLSEFQRAAVIGFIQGQVANPKNEKVGRVRSWLLNKLNDKRYISQQELQRGCPEVIPGLRAIPWWDTNEFPWIKHFEENFEVIRDEILKLRGQAGFQPYRGPSWISKTQAKDGIGSQSIDSGEWNVFYIYLHQIKFNANCQKLPKTLELIDKYLPRNYHHCFVSAVTKQTHIIKHFGPTNKKLRFHLPLMGVSGSRLRVADVTKQQHVGKAYVFDDSFEHEAWHDGNETRIILIADFWHPDLSDNEVKFLRLLQGAQLRFEKKMSENSENKDNFFSIIESAKTLLKSNDWWVVDEEQAGSSEQAKKEVQQKPLPAPKQKNQEPSKNE